MGYMPRCNISIFLLMSLEVHCPGVATLMQQKHIYLYVYIFDQDRSLCGLA